MVLIIMVFLTSMSTFAQTNSVDAKAAKKKFNAIESLIAGIGSDNEGLSRSSVYFAGLYRVPEAVEPLLYKMKNETDPSTKVLIALALFRIGDQEGMKMIESLALKDPNPKVRRMCSAIFNEYVSPDSLDYVAR
jgi:HEAT repeat protein